MHKQAPPNRLAQLRSDHGMVREDLARELGVYHSTVYRWESGRTRMDEDTIAKLAKFFGVTRAHLLGWDEDERLVEAKAA